jgi:hypothetical protein
VETVEDNQQHRTSGVRDGGKNMKRIKIFKWEIAVVWDFKRFHVSKNPVRKPKYPAKGE